MAMEAKMDLNIELEKIPDLSFKELRELYLYLFNQPAKSTRCAYYKINKQNIAKAYSLFPFGKDCYKDLDNMHQKIKHLCQLDGKKYIYAYYNDIQCIAMV
jgi:hypothetical protein